MPYKLRKAIIEDAAFVSLVTAAVDVYNKETIGLLIGSEHRGKLRIKNAIVYQKAARKADEVSISFAYERRIDSILSDMVGYHIVGDFHSHADYVDALSKADIRDIIESGIKITLLLGVYTGFPAKRWEYDKKNKVLGGTIDGKYLVTIKVYCREYQSRKLAKLKIECPFIGKMNKMHKDLDVKSGKKKKSNTFK